jgi:hypothetical protein
VSVNGTLIEDNMRRFKGEFAHFSFNKCLIYTHDGASAKFSTNSQEADNSVVFNSRDFSSVHWNRKAIWTFNINTQLLKITPHSENYKYIRKAEPKAKGGKIPATIDGS